MKNERWVCGDRGKKKKMGERGDGKEVERERRKYKRVKKRESRREMKEK